MILNKPLMASKNSENLIFKSKINKFAQQYYNLLNTENKFVRTINSQLESDNYLKSEKIFDSKINTISQFLPVITEIRKKQCELLTELLNQPTKTAKQDWLKQFLNKLFENNEIIYNNEAVIEKMVTLITEYLFPHANNFEENSLSYIRYVNAVIHRYAQGISSDSLTELLALLKQGKQTIQVTHGWDQTEIDPFDNQNKKCVDNCVLAFQTFFSQAELDEFYNKHPQAFHNYCLSTVYSGMPNQHVDKIEYLKIKLQDPGLHNFSLGIEKGKIRFYYSPEFMTIFHEELHALRILQGKAGTEEGYLPTAINQIYDCLEEYLNIDIGEHSEAHYCRQVSLPMRIGHNGIMLGDLPPTENGCSYRELSEYATQDYHFKTWVDFYQRASFFYQNTHGIDMVCRLIDEQIVSKIQLLSSNNSVKNNSLIRSQLLNLLLLKYEVVHTQDKTLNEIIQRVTQNKPANIFQQAFIEFLKKQYGNIVLSPSKKYLSGVCVSKKDSVQMAEINKTSELINECNSKSTKQELTKEDVRNEKSDSYGTVMSLLPLTPKDTLSFYDKNIKRLMNYFNPKEPYLLNDNLYIVPEDIRYSASDPSNSYTADYINLLAYRFNQNGKIKVHAATNSLKLSEILDVVRKQEENFAFIPLNIPYRKIKIDNHWVALIIDKNNNNRSFYLDPAQDVLQPLIPSVITEFSQQVVASSYNFQSKELEKGELLHCGVYILEMFKCFYNDVLDGQKAFGNITHNNANQVIWLANSVLYPLVESIDQSRKEHVIDAIAFLSSKRSVVTPTSSSESEIQESFRDDFDDVPDYLNNIPN